MRLLYYHVRHCLHAFRSSAPAVFLYRSGGMRASLTLRSHTVRHISGFAKSMAVCLYTRFKPVRDTLVWRSLHQLDGYIFAIFSEIPLPLFSRNTFIYPSLIFASTYIFTSSSLYLSLACLLAACLNHFSVLADLFCLVVLTSPSYTSCDRCFSSLDISLHLALVCRFLLVSHFESPLSSLIRQSSL